jgi:hypothetical protein
MPAQPAEPGWATLPPLLPSAVGVELTAPSTSFVRALTGRRAPNLALAPLGHDVRLDAPGGTLVGVARAVESTAVARSPFQFASRRLRRLVQRAAASVTSREAPTEPFEGAEDVMWEPEPEPIRAPEDAAGAHADLDLAAAAPAAAAPPGAPRVEAALSGAAPSHAPAAAVRGTAGPAAPLSPPAPAPPVRTLHVAASPVLQAKPLLTAPVDLQPPSPAVRMEPATEAVAEPPGASLEAAAPVTPTRPLRVVRRVGLGPPVRRERGAPAARPTVQRQEDAPEPEPSDAVPAVEVAETPEPRIHEPISEQRISPRERATPPPVIPVVMRSVQVEESSFVETSDPETASQVVETAPLVGDAELGAHRSTEVAQTIAHPASTDTPSSSQRAVLRELDLEPAAPEVERKQPTESVDAAEQRADIVRTRAVLGQASPPSAAAPPVAARRIATPEAVAGDPGVADDAADLPAEVPHAETPVPGRQTSPLLPTSPALPGARIVARRIEDAAAAPVERVERPTSRLAAPLAAARRIFGLATLQRSPEETLRDESASNTIVPTRRTEAASTAPAAAVDLTMQHTRTPESDADAPPPTLPSGARDSGSDTSWSTVGVQRVVAVDVTMQHSRTPESDADAPPPTVRPGARDSRPDTSRPTVGVQRVVAAASAPAEPAARSTTASDISPRPGVGLAANPQLAVQRRGDARSPVFPPPPLELVPRPTAAAAAPTPPTEPGRVTTFHSEEPVAVQRAENAAFAPVAEHAGGANVAAPAAASAHEAGAGQNLDELAAHLYDRIRARLRDELLIDRERAGLVTDVR